MAGLHGGSGEAFWALERELEEAKREAATWRKRCLELEVTSQARSDFDQLIHSTQIERARNVKHLISTAHREHVELRKELGDLDGELVQVVKTLAGSLSDLVNEALGQTHPSEASPPHTASKGTQVSLPSQVERVHKATSARDSGVPFVPGGLPYRNASLQRVGTAGAHAHVEHTPAPAPEPRPFGVDAAEETEAVEAEEEEEEKEEQQEQTRWAGGKHVGFMTLGRLEEEVSREDLESPGGDAAGGSDGAWGRKNTITSGVGPEWTVPARQDDEEQPGGEEAEEEEEQEQTASLVEEAPETPATAGPLAAAEPPKEGSVNVFSLEVHEVHVSDVEALPLDLPDLSLEVNLFNVQGGSAPLRAKAGIGLYDCDLTLRFESIPGDALRLAIATALTEDDQSASDVEVVLHASDGGPPEIVGTATVNLETILEANEDMAHSAVALLSPLDEDLGWIKLSVRAVSVLRELDELLDKHGSARALRAAEDNGQTQPTTGARGALERARGTPLKASARSESAPLPARTPERAPPPETKAASERPSPSALRMLSPEIERLRERRAQSERALWQPEGLPGEHPRPGMNRIYVAASPPEVWHPSSCACLDREFSDGVHSLPLVSPNCASQTMDVPGGTPPSLTRSARQSSLTRLFSGGRKR